MRSLLCLACALSVMTVQSSHVAEYKSKLLVFLLLNIIPLCEYTAICLTILVLGYYE